MVRTNICQICGGNGGLVKKQQTEECTLYACQYCGTQFEEGKLERYAEQLRAFLDEKKQEEVSSLKQLLYEEVHTKQYADNARILSLTHDIRKLFPDDFVATFFEAVCSGDVQKTCDMLCTFDVYRYDFAVDLVLDFMLRSVEPAYLLPLNNLIELAYKNTNLEKYSQYAGMLSSEAEKLDEGIYTPNLPRDVFVCYSSKDMPQVMQLVNYLEEVGGLSCFVAARNLKHGSGAVQSYADAIRTAIDYSKIIVFVSSENSRKISCDAMRFELPYVRKCDLADAPAQYKFDYEKLPATYKRPRVEYLLTPYTGVPTEKTAREFFSGNEWCYDAANVLSRVSDILTYGWSAPAQANSTPTSRPQPAYTPFGGFVTPKSAYEIGADATLGARDAKHLMDEADRYYAALSSESRKQDIIDRTAAKETPSKGYKEEVPLPILIENGVLRKYNVDADTVTVPANVTAIGQGAFSGCKALTTVTVPDGVTSIDQSAFSGCPALTTVIFTEGNHLKFVGHWAFKGCAALATVQGPADAVSAVARATRDLSYDVVITGCGKIADMAFKDCKGISSVTIGASVPAIGDRVFDGCDKITVRYQGTRKQWRDVDKAGGWDKGCRCKLDIQG